MRRIRQLLLMVSLLLVLGLGAGCGPNFPTGTTGARATLTIGIPPSPTVPPTLGGTTGPVTLQSNAAVYQAGDTIMVHVNNQSSQSIFFPDHLTNCTVILLQREKVQPQTSGNGQDGVNPCALAIATRMHSLSPGESLAVKLVAPKNGWLAGVYHAALNYRTTPTASSSVMISSNAFTVGPLVPQP